jgi:hypothetical protein
MANKYMKKGSICLDTKEVQIQTILRFYLTPVRTKNAVRMWVKGMLTHCWWEFKISAITVEISMEVPQEIKTRTTIWSCVYLKQCKAECNSDNAHPCLWQLCSEQTNYGVTLALHQLMNG